MYNCFDNDGIASYIDILLIRITSESEMRFFVTTLLIQAIIMT